ncbi:MAG: MFS transporter [Clostridia bacterium]|nr:MFS transporter [Clostridia bacterium]
MTANAAEEINAGRYTSRQKSTIAVAVVTSLITTVMGSSLNLAIPSIGGEFHVSAGMIGWVITGYMLVTATCSVPFGRLADLTDRKKVLVVGIAIFAFTSLAAVFCDSMMLLLAARMLQGVGAAMIFATNHAILISAFPGNMRGRVLGYALSATYIGLSAGPVIGGIFTHNFGWRSLFVFSFIISTFVLIIAAKGLDPQRSPQGTSLNAETADVPGNILYIVSLTMLLFGLTEINRGMWPALLSLAGFILLVLFFRHEMHTASPVVDVRLFKSNIAYTLSNIATLLNYGATFAITYMLSIYFQVVKGMDSQTAGFILITTPLVMAVLTPAAGRLSDRKSPYIMASAGMGICALPLFFYCFISKDTSVWIIIIALLVAGIGFATFSSPNTNAVLGCVDREYYGVASSLLATMRTMGHTLSMVAITVIVTMNMGSLSLAEAEPDTLIHTMHQAFTLFSLTCVAGVFISLKRNTNIKRE